MRLAGLAGFGGIDGFDQVVLKLRQLVQEVRAVGQHETVFELLVRDEVGVDGEDRFLKFALLLGIDAVGQAGLAFDLGDRGGDLAERKALFSVAVLRREVEEGEHVGMDDFETADFVGVARREADIEQPFGGRQRLAFGGHGALASLDGEQSGASNGIERLDPAVDEHRQATEAIEVEIAFGFVRKQRAGDECDAEKENDERDKTFHED